MPRYLVEWERSVMWSAIVEADTPEAAESVRPGFTPNHVTLIEIVNDDFYDDVTVTDALDDPASSEIE